MNIEPHVLEATEHDPFMIVRNGRVIDGNGINGRCGGSAARVRIVYDYWNGTRWMHQRCFALPFTTWEEAIVYLLRNWQQLTGRVAR